MKNLISIAVMLFSVLILQGCKEGMDLKPQDYFEGKQLTIAEMIYHGDEATLKKILPTFSKEELNRPAKEDITLLFWALNNAIFEKKTPEYLRIITALVKAGADPLQPRPNGGSCPAEFMLKADDGIWIKAMLDGGLSPNALDKVHNQPIIFEAFKAKNIETLKVMLEYGADINTKNSLGNSLLIDALDSRAYDHVIYLLDKGADSSIQGNSGWTMGNQLQRFINRTQEGTETWDKLEEIKTTLIKHGGEWPPKPVKK
ncbi:ankyrin repeat domain-containing protein [Serratia ficaria]|uniref:ankyrin repeat domain-containing protein n=1 Tax=Serratia ficaria TaxID=61651 RepID=UPI0021BDC945|nr:ankyrin repeat domain-containing protein [Serratia ficaria]